MPLQSTGSLSTDNINVELGRAGNSLWTTDQRQVRQLADSVTNSYMAPSTGELNFNSFYSKSRVRQHTFALLNTTNRIIGGGDLSARTWQNNPTYMAYRPGDDFGGFPEYSPANPPYPVSGPPYPDPYTEPYYIDSYSYDFILNANAFNVDPTNWAVNNFSFSFSGSFSNLWAFEFYCGFFSRQNLGVTWFENLVDIPQFYYNGQSGPYFPSITGNNFTCTTPFLTTGNWINSQTSTNVGNLATGIKNSGTNFTFSAVCRIFALPGTFPEVRINKNINVSITTTIN